MQALLQRKTPLTNLDSTPERKTLIDALRMDMSAKDSLRIRGSCTKRKDEGLSSRDRQVLRSILHEALTLVEEKGCLH